MSINGNGLWKTMFISLLSANLVGFGGWLMFGMDSVKHSEIDQIMATRAPYIHDRQRIDEHFNTVDRRLDKLEEKK